MTLFRCISHNIELPANTYTQHCDEFHGGDSIAIMITHDIENHCVCDECGGVRRFLRQDEEGGPWNLY